jgi:hypothetical protein
VFGKNGFWDGLFLCTVQQMQLSFFGRHSAGFFFGGWFFEGIRRFFFFDMGPGKGVIKKMPML